MIGYVTLGSNDIPAAAAFYDAVLATVGAKRVMEMGNFIVWGTSLDRPGLAITPPYDGQAATAGNGTMVALVCKDRATVDAVHAAALQAGGSDEGAPGERIENFYAGYFRDLDGNKLNAYCQR